MTDNKTYYLKHKWISDGREQYLKLNGRTGRYFLGGFNLYMLPTWQGDFTEKEIEEIKKKFDTTLSDFEMIEAKR